MALIEYRNNITELFITEKEFKKLSKAKQLNYEKYVDGERESVVTERDYNLQIERMLRNSINMSETRARFYSSFISSRNTTQE